MDYLLFNCMGSKQSVQREILEVMPDHHAILWAALTQNGMTEDEAISAVNNSWNQVHNDRVALWDQQVANDAEALRQQQQQEEQQAA